MAVLGEAVLMYIPTMYETQNMTFRVYKASVFSSTKCIGRMLTSAAFLSLYST